MRSESQKSEEEGGRLHFAFLPEHSDTYLIQMLIPSVIREHDSPTKAMCEVKLFMNLHKNICLIKLMAFVAYMCEYVLEGDVSVLQMEREETTKSNC